MAAPLLRKLLNQPSSLRLLVNRSNLSVSAFSARLSASQDKVLDLAEKPPTYHLGTLGNDEIPSSGNSTRIYRSFALGNHLVPMLLILPADLRSAGDEKTSERQTIWADSVKKKRKKKMNKHKYKKLRKRLRRKT